MDVNPSELASVDKKLNQQSALYAAVAASLWSVPTLGVWYYVFQINSLFAPIMIAISGALIGLVVRFHGKGYTPLFACIAFFSHLLLVLSAMSLGLLLGDGESIWAIILLGLYVAGAWFSAYLSRLKIPFSEHKAFFQLTELNRHDSSKKLKNRWFVALPLVTLLSVSILSFSMIVLHLYDKESESFDARNTAEAKRQAFADKAIDVTPEALKTMSDKDALLHTFAFHTGQLPNEYGYIVSRYPKSDYKAKAILKFLIEYRGSARAKLVLGLLTLDDNGVSLIRESASDGDAFAKIYAAKYQGCNGRVDMAIDMLTRMKSIYRKKSLKNQIDNILTAGFPSACRRSERSGFLLVHAMSL